MKLLEEIRAAGLTLAPSPGGLRVSPKARLTDELRQKIRAHKAELLAALNQEAVAWQEAGQAIELARRPTAPSSTHGVGNPAGRRETRP